MRISDWSSDVCSSDLPANSATPHIDAAAADTEEHHVERRRQTAAGADRPPESGRLSAAAESAAVPGTVAECSTARRRPDPRCAYPLGRSARRERPGLFVSEG